MKLRFRTPEEAHHWERFEHYRAIEWAFVQLSQLIFETRGKHACLPIIHQAHHYNRLARAALLGRAKAQRSPIPLD